MYEVKEETVAASDIGDRIGEVKTYPNDMTGNYYGNASNAYPKGTKYFEIINLPIETAIAVEVRANQWKKAEYVQEAPFHWMNVLIKLLPFLLIAISLGILVMMKRRKTMEK
ncbi:cytochrome c-type biogenesis protein [Litchfieldia alkalitelluris]|uniref:hypothetical protein n=1 Tax=Litchfieldia alkalitelluris TaxID=304268 RepID=UPI001F36B0CD|nr:hypothetical protein [Litchfieldia alkalitelluris]